MYCQRKKYFDFCRKLNKIIFSELICLGDDAKAELWYDEDDIMFQEIYIPMFEAIVFGLINSPDRMQMEKLLHTLCEDSYCVGDTKRITKLVDRLICFQSELLILYQEAKEEQKKAHMSLKHQELSNELDEYLRIGEELSKTK